MYIVKLAKQVMMNQFSILRSILAFCMIGISSCEMCIDFNSSVRYSFGFADCGEYYRVILYANSSSITVDDCTTFAQGILKMANISGATVDLYSIISGCPYYCNININASVIPISAFSLNNIPSNVVNINQTCDNGLVDGSTAIAIGYGIGIGGTTAVGGAAIIIASIICDIIGCGCIASYQTVIVEKK